MVTITTNATDISHALQVKSTQLSKEGEKLTRKIAQLAANTARGLSIFQKSFEQMRSDGHPYRWGGHAYGAPWRINKQSGHFYESWEVKETGRKNWGNVHGKDTPITYSLVNEATVQYSGNFNKRTGHNYKYSDLLAGTMQYHPKKGGGGTWGGMQERPIMDEIYKRIQPKVSDMVRDFGQRMGKWEHVPMRSYLSTVKVGRSFT